MKKPEAIGCIRTSSSGTWKQIEDSDPESWAKQDAGIDSMIAGFDVGEAGLLQRGG
jgi:hypothetical protein